MNCIVLRHSSAVILSSVLYLIGITTTAQNATILSGKLAKAEQRAYKGFTNDQWQLAEAYMKGNGVAQDYQRAAFWYERAAENGLPVAQHEIGYLYSVGLGVHKDAARAVHWYQLAASSGIAMARVNLGAMYLHGRGVRQDHVLARKYFTEAAERGEGVGAAYMGVLEFEGVGGPVDWAAAERWFKLGVKLHSPIAAYELSVFYLKYQKHPEQEVLELLRYSSGKGYVNAKSLLGSMLVAHPQSAESAQEAATVLQEASAAGEWHSTALLGEMMLKSIGLAADPEKAYYYLKLAILQGGALAEKSIHTLLPSAEASLSPEARVRQSENARTWHAAHELPLLFVPGTEGAVPVVSVFSLRAREARLNPAQ